MPVFEDVVCAFCGSLCDDLVVQVEENQIQSVRRACSIGRAKLMHAQKDLAISKVNGQEVPIDTAINEAVSILSQAHHPLVYGLSSTTTEAQREAVGLAEMIGGTIDNPSSY